MELMYGGQRAMTLTHEINPYPANVENMVRS